MDDDDFARVYARKSNFFLFMYVYTMSSKTTM
jgi:hypothetical protein